MSSQNINEIPEITFDAFIGAMNLEKEFIAETIVAETMDCPICMDPIDGNKNIVVTECGHKFHCSCLMKNSCHNGFDCPLCRAAMVEDMEEEEDEEEEDEEDEDEEDDDEEDDDDAEENEHDSDDEGEYDDDVHVIVIEDLDTLVEDITYHTIGHYTAEYSVMLILKMTNNEDLLHHFDRRVVNEDTEKIVKLIDIYKRTQILKDHFKKQTEKITEKKEQEMFAQEDTKIVVVLENPVMTVDESIQKIKNVLKEISELNSYAITLMKQVTPEIFHNKYQRNNISEFLKTLNINKASAGKNYFMENKNMIDEALNLLECKEKNE